MVFESKQPKGLMLDLASVIDTVADVKSKLLENTEIKQAFV